MSSSFLALPSTANFDLILNHTLAGVPVLENPVCNFGYDWDFRTNTGTANLIAINGTLLHIPLFPMGIAKQLDFMSDMSPTTYWVFDDNETEIYLMDVVIFRVVLDISIATGKRSGFVMFGQDGSVIQATQDMNMELFQRLTAD